MEIFIHQQKAMEEEGSSLMPTPDGLNLSKIAADEPRRQASEEGSASELQIDQDQSSSSNFLESTSEPEVKKKKNSYFILFSLFSQFYLFLFQNKYLRYYFLKKLSNWRELSTNWFKKLYQKFINKYLSTINKLEMFISRNRTEGLPIPPEDKSRMHLMRAKRGHRSDSRLVSSVFARLL